MSKLWRRSVLKGIAGRFRSEGGGVKEKLKEFSEMPKPKSLPFLGSLVNVTRYGESNMLQYFASNFKRLGNIYSENFGFGLEFVVSSNLETKHEPQSNF